MVTHPVFLKTLMYIGEREGPIAIWDSHISKNWKYAVIFKVLHCHYFEENVGNVQLESKPS